jgi:hypothetical protein
MDYANSSQAKEMADESMVRNLAAQADAIWPQEEPIFARHSPSGPALDVGCGTGEIACTRDPKGYALWQVPVWTARKP